MVVRMRKLLDMHATNKAAILAALKSYAKKNATLMQGGGFKFNDYERLVHCNG
jgi:UDP-N-acetylmuramoylalanine-D-glutamate ligase